MANWFTASDFASAVQQDVDTATANLLITKACDTVREEVRQDIDYVASDTITIYGDGDILLVLPQIPVTAISAVTYVGTALTLPAAIQWKRNGQLYRIATAASAYSDQTYYPWYEGAPVTVTYSHGWQTIPASIYMVAMELAIDAYTNPQHLVTEGIGGAQAVFASTGRLGPAQPVVGEPSAALMNLSYAQRRRLDPFRNPNL